MRKIFFVCYVIFLLSSLNNIFAQGANPVKITMNKTKQNPPEYKSDGSEGQRAPGIPILCLISSDGVEIDAIHSEILSYEIWSEEGELCIASTDEELVFTQTLFSISGNFQIRFITEDYTLVGYITI